MESRKQVWVTTVDNPFDPFTQWDSWYRYDENSGYHTCSRLAKLAGVSNKLSDAEIEDCIDSAIQRLLAWYEPYQIYALAIEGSTQRFGLAQ